MGNGKRRRATEKNCQPRQCLVKRQTKSCVLKGPPDFPSTLQDGFIFATSTRPVVRGC